MALVTSKEMFAKALKSDYAVGAFNVNNMEIIQGIVDAAKIENAPLILQVSAGARKYAKPTYLVKLVDAAIEDTGLDIVLHLDHGEDFEICKKCVDDGFTSVMIDGSKYPFEENIALTKQVVEYAHAKGVVVEAELGKLAGIEDNIQVDARHATFTDPDEAAEFVAKTGVDSLAISIGTSHGAYKFKGDPYLDFERLQKITSLIPETPLVLHGASTVLPEFVALCNQYGGNIPGAQGVPEEMIRTA
ncbi:MAG: ketose-bisphosphate aldolase, partial [Eubacteriales bacterium]|nr:ketose-bisphosphate aldolase [Eubacteriales bacterium]